MLLEDKRPLGRIREPHRARRDAAASPTRRCRRTTRYGRYGGLVEAAKHRAMGKAFDWFVITADDRVTSAG
jgi:hypothetical protein